VDIENLGEDSVNFGKVLILILIVVGIIVLAGYATNIPELQGGATIYWVLGLTSLAFLGVSLGIKKIKGIDFPNPIIHEKNTLFFGALSRKTWAIIIIGLSLVSLYIFFSMSSQTPAAIIGAPTFQVVEVTPTISTIFSIFAANQEDLFFFGVVPALLFMLVYIGSKNQIISLISAAIGSPVVFMFYHTLRYGNTMPASMQWVFMFGAIMTVTVLVTRSLVAPLFIHAANNAGIDFFRSTVLAGSNFYFIIFAVLILVVGGLYVLRSKGGG